jgi:uncharacterized protein YceH (UPF0502 family)
MALHPETFSLMLAGSMTGMVRAAAQNAADRRDQRALDAWSNELASARGDAAAMVRVATSAVRQLAESEAEVEDLRDEVARLRTLLAQRNSLIRQLSQ